MRVLVPTDGSPHAMEAVKFVRKLAQAREVEAVVLTVSFDPSHYSIQPWIPEWSEQEEQRTQEVLDSAKAALSNDCDTVTLVHGRGATVPCILEQAEKSGVDLIVLGAKGHSGIRRVLLGSVSDSIATNAKCSVVVVRSPEETKWDEKKVVMGFDQSVASREMVAELAEWNLPKDLEFEVVSVVLQPYTYVGDGYVDTPITVDSKRVQEMDEAAERMASLMADHFHHTTAKTPVAAHVGEAIITAAEQANAGLIMIGDTGHTLLGQLFLGSTSKYVMRHAPCSVWISRHHWHSVESPSGAQDTVDA